MGYKIITVKQKNEWIACVQHADMYDFYHTWQYHSLIKEGEAFLFLYKEKGDFIAFPLIKRAVINSDFFDLTSAYGYVGPIGNRQFGVGDDDFLENFKNSFLGFMKEERIISVFSRLHPIITQRLIMNKFGGIFQNGQTVVIDLDIPIEVQRKCYRKDHSNAIRSLREKEYYVKDASNLEGVKIFASIYHENMKRINASKEYFFGEEYFRDMVKASEFKSHILLVYLNENPVAGGVFTFTNDIIQVHLLSTLTKYLHQSPVKLLIDEVSIVGRKLGMRYLHMGGGFGGRNDSLFSWKSGFSDTYLNFETWRYISNQSQYDEIVKCTVPEPQTQQADYFPLYRKVFA